jgi:hypothetical protein
MENNVGDNLPAAEEFTARLAELDDIVAWLQKFCAHLSPEARAALTRGRRGAEPYLVQIAETAKKYGWNAPGVTPDQVLNDLRVVRELDPIRQRLAFAQELVDDTMAQGGSEANEGGYMFYGIAQSMGSRIPEVEAAVRPFAEFLSSTRKKRTTKDDGGNPTG